MTPSTLELESPEELSPSKPPSKSSAIALLDIKAAAMKNAQANLDFLVILISFWNNDLLRCHEKKFRDFIEFIIFVLVRIWVLDRFVGYRNITN
ncbi:hypothetical protein [Devosia soli]|uniref:hypothetical protein n=1 Tax=Devosia soli TaxID=361041 RepID=UPI00128D5060|nr:hypothetical protein [Devosia soli]